ncbi:sigma-54 dependent transcriptional regulator [Desulfobacula sp.]|uniref:sigma-54-dependent transcriptional regulator n=1 Tax=Desulfobacula sp. TaxID=2593537 RepID=UPI0026393F7F|nr:sigma-54 dependent transcriptional regulator [Desulfobacula sp.]
MPDTRSKKNYKVLIVDDSIQTLEVIQRNLNANGYDAYTCSSVRDAVRFLMESTIDIVITDFKMPKQNGLELIRHIRDNFYDIEIIMITGYPDIEDAVQAIKDGADDYLVKPFTDDELLLAVQRMVEKLNNRRFVESTAKPAKTYGIIGESAKMKHVFHRIEKASGTNATVLISGDSGTGKEIVARAIHYNSERRRKPFVPVNCTAIPDTLLESELFGHVKGAFTGARDKRDGFFQIADGGTIFLDEIGDASLNMQGKLLRVLQNKEIRPVGSPQIQHVNTRIVAATHKDLPGLVGKGLFREDLFYRLNVIDIVVPALNERSDDILSLINYFAHKFSNEMNCRLPVFSDNVINALKRYSWPGNVRELENLIQRLVVMLDGHQVKTTDLPESMRFNISIRQAGKQKLNDVVADHVLNILTITKGNKTQAAKIMGIDRKTLNSKLKKIENKSQDY